MIEEDPLSYHPISFLYETSYYRVEVFVQDTQVWKSYTIQEKEYISYIMPYLFSWNIHVCMHANQLQLLFRYHQGTTMHELFSTMNSLDEAITQLQNVLLTLQQEQVEDSISYLLCDQKNLVLCDNNQWNLYGSPRLEVLLRKTVMDELSWQHLCANVLTKLLERNYMHLPTPSIVETTIAQLQGTQKLEIHQMITLLGQLSGCYQGILPKPKRYRRVFHYIIIILLVLMVLMSILFFAYEYRKAHQEFFHDIEQIGDVLVNPNE